MGEKRKKRERKILKNDRKQLYERRQ